MCKNENFFNKEFIKKSEKLLSDYDQSTGSCSCIYDKTFKQFFPSKINSEFCPENRICPHCNMNSTVNTDILSNGVSNTDAKNDRMEAYPCHKMHINAIKEAEKKGGAHIYQCSLGLLFWVSPIYFEGVFSGAVRGSGILKDNQKAVDILWYNLVG